MATVDLGKISFVNKGTYAASTTYEERDVVQFTDGALSSYVYINATPASGQTPSTGGTVNSSHWSIFAGGVSLAVGNNKIVTSDGSGTIQGLSIGSAGHFLRTNSSANGYEFAAVSQKLKQVKHYQNTTRTSPTGAGTYLNWGSFTKLNGTDTDLIMHGTIHAHQQYGNNVGNPSIRWNSHDERVGFVRTFSQTSYQLGFSFIVRFASKAAGTSNITWELPGDDHRWQTVINPTNSDNGVSSRYTNGVGSTVTVYEVDNT